MLIEETHEESKIVTTSNYKDVQYEYEHMLEDAKSSSDKLKLNYTERYFKDNIILYSVMYRHDIPCHFSNVITRDIFNKGARLMNRYYIISDRRVVKPGIPHDALMMLNQQQKMTFEMTDMDYVFLSREYDSHLLMKKIVREYSRNFDIQWKYEKERYKVCESENDSCYQWISWFSSTITKIPLTPKLL